jgi:hypothetical protein
MNIIRRVLPAILLFFLAPLVAEYLLGDLNVDQLDALVALAPLYGGGAILIRELVRRTGRGWPSFLLLALAYALLEEGILTQSLFNPDYLHLRLIDYGFVPALGTAIPWAVFVLTIHIVWSLAVPIGLAESLFPDRRTQPWLGRIGLAVAALLLAAGAAAVVAFSLGSTSFRASPLQIAVCLILVLLLVAGAFAIRRRPDGQPVPRPVVSPWLVGAASIAGGAGILAAFGLGKSHLQWPLTAVLSIAVALLLCAFFAWATAGRRWTTLQTWAAALGAMLCYVLYGYYIDHSLHGPGGAATHSIFVVALLIVAGIAGYRAQRALPSTGG